MPPHTDLDLRVSSRIHLVKNGRFGSNASLELCWHVSFTPDFGHMVATQRTDASGHEETCAVISSRLGKHGDANARTPDVWTARGSCALALLGWGPMRRSSGDGNAGSVARQSHLIGDRGAVRWPNNRSVGVPPVTLNSPEQPTADPKV